MIRLFATALVLVITIVPLFADSISGTNKGGVSAGISNTIGAPGAIQFNIVTDFGAACNGVADDQPAFLNAGISMRADPRVIAGAPVTLTVPPGAHCNMASCTGPGSNAPVFYGLNDFTWIMTGATMSSGGGGCLQWGNGNLDGNVPLVQQPFNTVSAGASCVTMTNPGDEAKYPPGRWALAGAMGLQGSGYPPNFGIYEYLQVASEGTGQVCFTTPLVNGYKSTWTDLGEHCSGWSCGANPHLYLMDKSWSHTYTVIGGTWKWYTETYFSSQNAIFNGVTFIADCTQCLVCFTPTLSQTITFNNVSITNCNIEADKEVDQWILNNSSISPTIFQSSSFKNLTLNNSTVAFLNGTPQHTFCNNSTIGGIIFGNPYGNALSFAGTNCSITGAITKNDINPGSCFSSAQAPAYCVLTYAGAGVMQILHLDVFSAPQWWVPGTVMNFTGTYRAGFPFTVGDNSYAGTPGVSGGLFTLNTDFAGAALPSPPFDPASGLGVVPDLMRDWSCSNCTGGPQAIDWSQAPAQHRPLWTYTNRTYTCTANLPNVPNSLDLNSPPQYMEIGNFDYLTVNVSTPDTGALPSVFMNPTSQFGRYPVINQLTGAPSFLDIVINVKISGTRTLTPTTATGTQSGDTLTPPGANSWLGSSSTTLFIDQDLTGEAAAQCPVVTVTWQATR